MARIPINHRKKQKVFERDGFKCINCGKTKEYASLEVDHIIPVVDGGNNELNNLQTLCYECNMNKRWGKDTLKTNKLQNLSPELKLKLIKDKINEYKSLEIDEFKVMYVLDKFFRKMCVPRDDVCNLFIRLTGKEKKRVPNKKYLLQRNKMLYLLRTTTKINYREMEKLLNKEGIKMSFEQISKICKKYNK